MILEIYIWCATKPANNFVQFHIMLPSSPLFIEPTPRLGTAGLSLAQITRRRRRRATTTTDDVPSDTVVVACPGATATSDNLTKQRGGETRSDMNNSHNRERGSATKISSSHTHRKTSSNSNTNTNNNKQRTRRDDKKPVETCPSFRSGHLPHLEDVQRLRELSAPHVESFNYFLDSGLRQAIQDIEPMELVLVDPTVATSKLVSTNTAASAARVVDWKDATTVRFWVEEVKITRPMVGSHQQQQQQQASSSRFLGPRECRERGLHYAAPMTGAFCYTIVERRNGVAFSGPMVRLRDRSFGNMPIMVMSKACHLKDLAPKDLVKLKEEVGDTMDRSS
jgi:hypothetical protein